MTITTPASTSTLSTPVKLASKSSVAVRESKYSAALVATVDAVGQAAFKRALIVAQVDGDADVSLSNIYGLAVASILADAGHDQNLAIKRSDPAEEKARAAEVKRLGIPALAGFGYSTLTQSRRVLAILATFGVEATPATFAAGQRLDKFKDVRDALIARDYAGQALAVTGAEMFVEDVADAAVAARPGKRAAVDASGADRDHNGADVTPAVDGKDRQAATLTVARVAELLETVKRAAWSDVERAELSAILEETHRALRA